MLDWRSMCDILGLLYNINNRLQREVTMNNKTSKTELLSHKKAGVLDAFRATTAPAVIAVKPEPVIEVSPEVVISEPKTDTQLNEVTKPIKEGAKKRGRPSGSSKSAGRAGEGDHATFTITVSREDYKRIFSLALKESEKTGKLWSPQKLVKRAISAAFNINIK